VQAALPALLPLLDEADDRLRRETAHLLAWFPSFAPVSLPRLRWPAERLLWKLMLVAFENDPRAPRPPFAGLNPLQQHVVAALTQMPWIWQAAPGERVPADNPLFAYGLPSTQQGLRSYASDGPPK
jgi:hypothetical protein